MTTKKPRNLITSNTAQDQSSQNEPRQLYQIATRVIRTRDRVRWLNDCFHYPVGFDCDCDGYCEACQEEDSALAGYAEELKILNDWLTVHEASTPKHYLEAAFKTRKSKWMIWQDHSSGWALSKFAVTSYALKHFGLAQLYRDAKRDPRKWQWYDHQKNRAIEYLDSIRRMADIGYADFDRRYPQLKTGPYVGTKEIS